MQINFKTERERFIWLAAMIDSEGWFIIECHNVKRRSNKSYHAKFGLKIREKEILEIIKEICLNKGNIRKIEFDNPKWSTIYSYDLNTKTLEVILPLVYPFLIAKKNQAKILLEAMDILKELRISGGYRWEKDGKKNIEKKHKKLQLLKEKINKCNRGVNK